MLHVHTMFLPNGDIPIESDNSNSFFQFLVLHESRFGARHASKDSAERGKFSVLWDKTAQFVRAGHVFNGQRTGQTLL